MRHYAIQYRCFHDPNESWRQLSKNANEQAATIRCRQVFEGFVGSRMRVVGSLPTEKEQHDFKEVLDHYQFRVISFDDPKSAIWNSYVPDVYTVHIEFFTSDIRPWTQKAITIDT